MCPLASGSSGKWGWHAACSLVGGNSAELREFPLPHDVHPHRDLQLEILALRKQLTVLQARHPRPRLTTPEKVLCVMLRRFWSGWKRTLVIVQPDTVVRWHRAGFKLYWTWRSRYKTRAGRQCVEQGNCAIGCWVSFRFNQPPGWLLKNSLSTNLQKSDRVRTPYKRFAGWPRHSIPTFGLVFLDFESFNSSSR